MTGDLSQRKLAGLISGGLFLVLLFVAWKTPVPYVSYTPGDTINVLGTYNNQPIVEVTGHPVYRDTGQLRMVTVFVTRPDYSLSLLEAMASWLSPNEALYPRNVVYPDHQSVQQAEQESAVQMASSQDEAVAAALTDLGYHVKAHLSVAGVDTGTPADGVLKVHDLLLRVNGQRITNDTTLVKQVETGKPLTLVVLRNGKRQTVQLTPRLIDKKMRMGVLLGVGFTFPFDVHLNVAPGIGGPSAGLMFSLAIYDTLTPGSLTDGRVVAGTGTIDASGKVGPIGGIQQKIAAADDAGAKLFFVPADNCDEALKANPGDMRLVKVATMHDATTALAAWDANPDVALPMCEAK